MSLLKKKDKKEINLEKLQIAIFKYAARIWIMSSYRQDINHKNNHYIVFYSKDI